MDKPRFMTHPFSFGVLEQWSVSMARLQYVCWMEERGARIAKLLVPSFFFFFSCRMWVEHTSLSLFLSLSTLRIRVRAMTESHLWLLIKLKFKLDLREALVNISVPKRKKKRKDKKRKQKEQKKMKGRNQHPKSPSMIGRSSLPFLSLFLFSFSLFLPLSISCSLAFWILLISGHVFLLTCFMWLQSIQMPRRISTLPNALPRGLSSTFCYVPLSLEQKEKMTQPYPCKLHTPTMEVRIVSELLGLHDLLNYFLWQDSVDVHLHVYFICAFFFLVFLLAGRKIESHLRTILHLQRDISKAEELASSASEADGHELEWRMSLLNKLKGLDRRIRDDLVMLSGDGDCMWELNSADLWRMWLEAMGWSSVPLFSDRRFSPRVPADPHHKIPTRCLSLFLDVVTEHQQKLDTATAALLNHRSHRGQSHPYGREEGQSRQVLLATFMTSLVVHISFEEDTDLSLLLKWMNLVALSGLVAAHMPFISVANSSVKAKDLRRFLQGVLRLVVKIEDRQLAVCLVKRLDLSRLSLYRQLSLLDLCLRIAKCLQCFEILRPLLDSTKHPPRLNLVDFLKPPCSEAPPVSLLPPSAFADLRRST